MADKTIKRYPGAMPFQDNEHDRKVFYGRDTEAKNLLNLVLSENLIVIYGKSGMGKTSLINAGLLNPLREKGCFPVTVRFTGNNPSETIMSMIEEKAKACGILFQETDKESLWAYFYFNGFMDDSGLLTPVIILDQFEEFFFLYEEEEQAEFITQLAQLVRGIVPAKYKSEVNISTNVKPEVKVIISLREDYLGYLEKMAISIPTILRIRFRVSTLTREQAMQAITEPARIVDTGFSTAPFSFDTSLVEDIIDLLCSRNKGKVDHYKSEVEAFPLQWICQYIENSVYERQSQGEKNIVITRDLIGDKERINQIFRDYYGKMLLKLSLGTRKHKAVVKLFEKGLISASWKRLSLEEEDIEDHYNVSREILHQLVELRILHMEPRAEGTYYELSHDTLVTAIQETKTTRKSKRQNVGILRILMVGVILILCYIILSIIGFNRLGLVNLPFALMLLLILFLALIIEVTDRDYLVGVFYYVINQKKKSVSYFLKSIDKNNVVSSYGFLGLAYYYIGKYRRAMSILLTAIELEPEDVTNYYYLASAYRKLEKNNSAKEMFRRLCIFSLNSLKKDGVELRDDISNLGDIDLLKYTETIFSRYRNKEVFLGMIEFYILYEKYDAAYELCIQQMPVLGKNPLLLCLKAEIELHINRTNEAIQSYQEAIRRNKNMMLPYIELGMLYFKMSMYRQALKLFKKAYKINPNDVQVSSFLNAARYKNGEYEKELQKIRKELHENLKTLGISSSEYINNNEVDEKLINTIMAAVEINPNDIASYIDLGDYYIRNDEFDKAKELYSKVLELDEDNLRAYEMLGYILIQLKMNNEAIKMYQKAIQLKSKDPDTYRALGWLLSGQGKNEDARALYYQTLEMDPKCGDAYYHLGFLATKEGKTEEAKQFYSKAIELNSVNNDVYMKYGYLYLNEENYKEAKIQFEKALSLGVATSDLYCYLSNVYIAEKDYDQALYYLNKASEIDPEDDSYHLIKGEILAAKGKYQEALEQYNMILRRPNSPEYLSALYDSATCYADMKELMQAEEAATKYINLKPEDATGYELLGRVLYVQDRYEEAKKELIKSLELGAQDEETSFMLGNIYFNLDEDYDKALEMYRKVISINPQYTTGYENMGHVYFQQKKYEVALEYFMKAINLGQVDSNIYVHLSIVYRELGDKEKEYETMKRAYELNPDNIDAIGGLGWIYYEYLKNFEEAISLDRKAIAINPKVLWIHANLALALLCKQQFEDAKSEYGEIIQNITEGYYENIPERSTQELVEEFIMQDLSDAKNIVGDELLPELNEMMNFIKQYTESRENDRT